MTRVFRTPLVAFAFLVDRLRRLPGARFVQEHQFWVVAGLLVAAAIVLGAWAATRSPQRVSMADLTAGSLAPLQTWIIITGDMRADSQSANGYSYVLTDPGIADATLAVSSETALPVGFVTVSGTLVGGDAPQHEGFAWRGQLISDPVLAREPDPPWLAIGLAALAAFIAAAARMSYPLFFKETPTQLTARAGSLHVQARRDWPPEADTVDATLTIRPGEPLEVTLAGEGPRIIRLHSAHSSVDAGVLRTLSTSEPALVVRPPSGELTFTFASDAERDSVYAALVADVVMSTGRPVTLG